jgi:XTP/dITP diphosphohydrolase
VFAGEAVANADEVVTNWETLKAAEKPEREGPFDGVPAALPALQLAAKLQSRAERAGLAPELRDRAADEVRAHLDRLDAAADQDVAVGDLLAAVVALARDRRVDPEQALRAAAARLRASWESRSASP